MTVDAGGFTGGRGGDTGGAGLRVGAAGMDSGLRRNDGWVGGAVGCGVSGGRIGVG